MVNNPRKTSGKPPVRPRPKAKGKPQATARKQQSRKTVPAARPQTRKIRVKPRKPKASMKPKTSRVVSSLLGQVKQDRKMKCISPTSLTFGASEGIYQRVLIAIDEFIFRATVNKPSLFQCVQSNNDPAIGYQTLRGIWLYAFYYYMYRCKCTSTDFVSGQSYSRINIPVGLAKIFQQFAPYVDPNTGAVYRYSVPAPGKTISPNNQNVDATFDPTDTSLLGSPLLRYLIHPSTKNASNVEIVEYATLGDRSFGPAPTTQVPFDTFFPAIDTSILSKIENLFDGTICVEEIPVYAPDASAYCWFTPSAVVSPSPIFRPDIAVMCGRGFQSTSFDIINNFPYDAPLPVCRTTVDGSTEQSPNSGAYIQTLLQSYAYLTGKSRRFAAGSAIGLMKSTGCFTDVQDFSYRAVSIDLSKFARKMFNVFKSDNWISTLTAQETANLQFTFSTMAWTAMLNRLFESASVNCTGNPATNTAFWTGDAKSGTCYLPVVIEKMISSMGPVRVGGKVVYPYLGLNFSGVNTPTNSNNIGWTKAVSAMAVWNVSSVAYGFGNSVTPTAAPLNVCYPNTTTPLARTDPVGVVYSASFSKNLSTYITAYQNKFPTTFNIDTAPSVSNEACGTLPGMLMNTNYLQSASVVPTWASSGLTSTGVYAVQAVVSAYCADRKDALECANFSLAADTGQDTAIRPLRILPSSLNVDIETSLQQTQNSSDGSVYQSQTKALATSNMIKGKKGKSGLSMTTSDMKYKVANNLIENAISDTQDRVFENGSGDRADLLESLTTLGKAAIKSGTKEALHMFGLGFGSQTSGGSADYYTRLLHDITTPQSDSKNGLMTLSQAEDSIGDFFGDLFG